MGMPAARLGDMHVCPMVTVLVPHVGGPIAPPCWPNVLIGGMPAARVGDRLVCVGPPGRCRAGIVQGPYWWHAGGSTGKLVRPWGCRDCWLSDSTDRLTDTILAHDGFVPASAVCSAISGAVAREVPALSVSEDVRCSPASTSIVTTVTLSVARAASAATMRRSAPESPSPESSSATCSSEIALNNPSLHNNSRSPGRELSGSLLQVEKLDIRADGIGNDIALWMADAFCLGDLTTLDHRLYQRVVARDSGQSMAAQQIRPGITGPQASKVVVASQQDDHCRGHHDAGAALRTHFTQARVRLLQARSHLQQHLGSRQTSADALKQICDLCRCNFTDSCPPAPSATAQSPRSGLLT